MKNKSIVIPYILMAMVLVLCTACGTDAHQHVFGTEWVSNSAYHWHDAKCQHADLKAGFGGHVWNGMYVSDNNASTTEAGTMSRSCTVCGYKDTVLDPDAPMIHEHVFATAWESDSTMHWHPCLCEHVEEIVREEHCFDGDECTVCGYERSHEHEYAEEWSFDENYHWKQNLCEHDDAVVMETHEGDQEYCSVCGYQLHEYQFDIASSSLVLKVYQLKQSSSFGFDEFYLIGSGTVPTVEEITSSYEYRWIVDDRIVGTNRNLPSAKGDESILVYQRGSHTIQLELYVNGKLKDRIKTEVNIPYGSYYYSSPYTFSPGWTRNMPEINDDVEMGDVRFVRDSNQSLRIGQTKQKDSQGYDEFFLYSFEAPALTAENDGSLSYEWYLDDHLVNKEKYLPTSKFDKSILFQGYGPHTLRVELYYSGQRIDSMSYTFTVSSGYHYDKEVNNWSGCKYSHDVQEIEWT